MSEPDDQQTQAMQDLENLHRDTYYVHDRQRELESLAVAHARAVGVTWQMLADTFGGSRQSWQQRYALRLHNLEAVKAHIDKGRKPQYNGPPKSSPLWKKRASGEA